MNNTMIARLLAKENISVQHGNYRTAFFDVEKRVLGLPQWKNMGKDVYDLLVGHEVGHALFTPADGWHESDKEIPGVPRAYINVVEDIRIEKLIQRQYPGLVGSFKRGYSVLDEQDFFGISEKNINEMHIADRINLKAKLRDLIDVEFKTEESDIINQVFAVETWEDVLAACRALYDFVESNKDESNDDIEDEDTEEQSFSIPSNDAGQDNGSAEDEEDSSDKSDDLGDNDSDEAGREKDLSDETEGELQAVTASDEEESTETKSVETKVGVSAAGHTCETDEVFRQREADLLDLDDRGCMFDVIKGVTREQADYMTFSYKEVFELRDEYRAELNSLGINPDARENVGEAFEKFKTDSKKFVNLMAKEFEMRKMAYRYSRSQSARSGSLDMNKLHAYKVTDDIFNRVTQLADAKSHGLMMFVDWSGSMGSVALDVVKQTLLLAEFCKKVSIPFEVYTFTSGNPRGPVATEDGEIDCDSAKIAQVLSSTMSKRDYARGVEEMFKVGSNVNYYSSKIDGMGGTPLNETIMASRFLIREFKQKYKVQKTNVVFLTDGDAQNMYYRRDYNVKAFPTAGIRFDIDGKFISTTRRTGGALTPELLNMLRKECGVIGYFIADSMRAFRGKVYQAANKYVYNEEFNAIRKEYNKQKFYSYDNVLGYDKFFILKGENGSLNTDDDEFEVSADAKKAEIQRAFKKHATSKKANKILATQFAQMVA